MTTTQSEILHVPGARFYYEVRGSGPVLLMTPGGPVRLTETTGCEAGTAGSFGKSWSLLVIEKEQVGNLA